MFTVARFPLTLLQGPCTPSSALQWNLRKGSGDPDPTPCSISFCRLSTAGTCRRQMIAHRAWVGKDPDPDWAPGLLTSDPEFVHLVEGTLL